jgi:hypothetical protein
MLSFLVASAPIGDSDSQSAFSHIRSFISVLRGALLTLKEIFLLLASAVL